MKCVERDKQLEREILPYTYYTPPVGDHVKEVRRVGKCFHLYNTLHAPHTAYCILFTADCLCFLLHFSTATTHAGIFLSLPFRPSRLR